MQIYVAQPACAWNKWTMQNEMNTVKIGDKLNLPANYRGEQIPVTEWTVVKENAKSFKVCGTVNSGLPNWRSFNLFLSKTTGKITA